MKRKRIIILSIIFIIGLIVGFTMSYLNKKANNLTPTEVNSKIINYMASNLDEIPNYSYNYVDEGKNAVVVGLKKNNTEAQEEFYKRVFSSSDIKKIKSQKIIVFEQGKLENELYERIIKVNDKLYYDTGEVSEEARCGVMDGKITSHVENDQIPTKNNQSNFSGDFSYQLGNSSTIDVLINGQWITFKTRQ